jgi:hypothetical protein
MTTLESLQFGISCYDVGKRACACLCMHEHSFACVSLFFHVSGYC